MSVQDYKEQLVESVKSTVGGVQEKVSHLIGQENIEAAKVTVRDTMGRLLSSEAVEGVKEVWVEEAAMVTGYKDRIVGEVKETVGSLIGNSEMEKQGHEQKLRGEAELATLHREGETAETLGENDIPASLVMNKQALNAEINKLGGFEGQKDRLRHVETHETNLSDMLTTSQSRFHLKKFDDKPLMEDICSFGDKHSLHPVEPREKGLLHTLPIEKENFHLKEAPQKRLFSDLNKEGALTTLHPVPASEIEDRSAPRFDLSSSSTSVPATTIPKLLTEIKQYDDNDLKHVETQDKSLPSLTTATPSTTTASATVGGENILLKKIKEGVELKHVTNINDKSRPNIIKPGAFLDEGRQGTEAKHI